MSGHRLRPDSPGRTPMVISIEEHKRKSVGRPLMGLIKRGLEHPHILRQCRRASCLVKPRKNARVCGPSGRGASALPWLHGRGPPSFRGGSITCVPREQSTKEVRPKAGQRTTGSSSRFRKPSVARRSGRVYRGCNFHRERIKGSSGGSCAALRSYYARR